MTGLLRTPATVAMYRTRRTWARPPQIQRLPRSFPLSRLNGARLGQCGDLLAVEHAKFRQLREQSTREHLADAGHRTQQLVALAPQGSIADQLAEFIVETRKSLFQPADVLIDATV